jgi:hypothetical protein
MGKRKRKKKIKRKRRRIEATDKEENSKESGNDRDPGESWWLRRDESTWNL